MACFHIPASFGKYRQFVEAIHRKSATRGFKFQKTENDDLQQIGFRCDSPSRAANALARRNKSKFQFQETPDHLMLDPSLTLRLKGSWLSPQPLIAQRREPNSTYARALFSKATLSVAPMRICNPDRSPVGINH